MNDLTLKELLSTIHSFEDYEKLKSLIENDLVKAIINKHQLPEAALTLFPDGTNIVFSFGAKVIKIFPPVHQTQFESERLILKHLDGKLSVRTPRLEEEGELFGWPYLIISRLEGTLLETLWETMSKNNKIVILHELGELIREVHTLSTEGLEAIDCHWPQFIEKQIAQCVTNHQNKGFPPVLLKQLPDYLESAKELVTSIKKPVILTGEYTPMNFLVNHKDDMWHISGLIDFGDAMLGLPEYDLLGPGAFLIQGDKQLLETFIMAYGYSSSELTGKLSHQLTALMLLHQYSNLKVQIRIANWEEQVQSLEDLESLVWGFKR
ncbi:aminoglycoside phosphotransferase family protein [Legionella genomosp. 1]|uniref:aminoglycoside phosphotransferase family protein n=1 Tax=Legionella genomosp. 1 TaxID=1093625 RepID=UPI0010557E5A|nr:aminoglycoside 3'-phosphotransferase/choline kinase family protein [Legionella genomosp. 1]